LRHPSLSGNIRGIEAGLMMLFLTKLPLWQSGLLLVGLTTALAMMGPSVIRRHVSLSRLSSNNEVAGFKFAVVGVLYAVAIAFAVIVVWEKFNEAVIAQDWPGMADATGGGSDASSQALDQLYAATLGFHPENARDTSVQRSILRQLEIITASRRIRGVLSAGIMPGVVWWLLFGGALVTIAFQYFFGTENVRAQTMMAGMLTALIFASLLIVVAINYPFSGPVRIDPGALQQLLVEWRGAAQPVSGS
jgi:hypothetical protein